MSIRLSRCALTILPVIAVASIAPAAHAGGCTPNTGPDVIVGDFWNWITWGTVGGVSAYSFGAVSCNIGDEVLPWIANSNQHPVIAQNAYRLKDGRFEQIGMSWLKHGWGAATEDLCCNCINPNNFEALGVGCSDPYDAGLNGNQSGFPHNGHWVAGLGPRSEVNGFTGEYLWPYGSQTLNGNTIYKRLQIHMEDLVPALNKGAEYFAECQYITPHDAQAGNGLNNASHKRFEVNPALINGAHHVSFDSSYLTERGTPAVGAWALNDTGVSITNVAVPDEGMFLVGSKCTDNGDGTWHYEYAVQNLNSHRAARLFWIRVPASVTVSNIGFHDVDYHSGEPFSGTDWTAAMANGGIEWITETFAANPNANALRWGTLYNFRFDANTPPAPSMAGIGLFRPGTPAALPFTACAPSSPGPIVPGDVNGDGLVNVIDLLAVIGSWGPCANCPADLNDDNVVDVNDLLMVVGNWS